MRVGPCVVLSLTLLAGIGGTASALESGSTQPDRPSSVLDPVSAGGLRLTGRTTSLLSALKTTKTTPNGSVAEGAMDYDWTRTADYGQYGNALFRYQVTVSTPAPQFDVGVTAWNTDTNLTGGQVFGAWVGSNTPSSSADHSGNPLNQAYSAGAAIGAEINVGNRWADFGLQASPGARFTASLQVVPDVLPAKDGPTRAVYPGSFGIHLGASVGGHRWWVDEHLKYDTVMAGGHAYLVSGGSAAASAPQSLLTAQGHWQAGIDFLWRILYRGRAEVWLSASVGRGHGGGGQRTPATIAGYIVIEVDGIIRKISYFAK